MAREFVDGRVYGIQFQRFLSGPTNHWSIYEYTHTFSRSDAGCPDPAACWESDLSVSVQLPSPWYDQWIGKFADDTNNGNLETWAAAGNMGAILWPPLSVTWKRAMFAAMSQNKVDSFSAGRAASVVRDFQPLWN